MQIEEQRQDVKAGADRRAEAGGADARAEAGAEAEAEVGAKVY